MGFGTIFATIAMVAIMGISSYLFITGALFTMDTLSNSLKKINEIDNARLKTEIEIGNVSVKPSNPGSGSDINVSINNTGATKILNSEFEHIDVFVYYHNDTVGGNIAIHRWMPYNDTNYDGSALQDNEWTVVNITQDLINPGIFDPDEEIKIMVRVYPAIDGTIRNWLKVVTPNAVSDAKYF
jgi:flagellar protein FlaF